MHVLDSCFEFTRSQQQQIIVGDCTVYLVSPELGVRHYLLISNAEYNFQACKVFITNQKLNFKNLFINTFLKQKEVMKSASLTFPVIITT